MITVYHSTHHVYTTVLTICIPQYSPCVYHSTHHLYTTVLTICIAQYSPFVYHSTHHLYSTVLDTHPHYYLHEDWRQDRNTNNWCSYLKFVSSMGMNDRWFYPPIKLAATISNWNIVESGVKHHNLKPWSQTWKEWFCIVCYSFLPKILFTSFHNGNQHPALFLLSFLIT
jgi:hypothetical protein